MKIVYISTGLYTGGAENMLYKLLSKMNRERFQPSVVSLMNRGTFGERIESLGVPVYTLELKPGEIPRPNVVLKLIRTIQQIKPDLIQGWMHQGNLAALLCKLFTSRKIPVLWGIRGTVYSLKQEKILTRLIIKSCAFLSNFCSNIIYVSHVAQKQHEALGYPKNSKSVVVPNGFETSLFSPSPDARLSFRAELGLPETTFLIGLICRYHPMKDHENFLNAAALVLKSYPEIHFILAGREVDKENNCLNALIKELGIQRQVHLLGERRDINRLTAALDIASSASAYGEGFPNVIGEAMSCSVPCAVTDVGDSAMIVGDTGIVVPPCNSEALANAWKKLIEMGSEQRANLGKAARQRILECFSLESIVHQYESLYEKVS